MTNIHEQLTQKSIEAKIRGDQPINLGTIELSQSLITALLNYGPFNRGLTGNENTSSDIWAAMFKATIQQANGSSSHSKLIVGNMGSEETLIVNLVPSDHKGKMLPPGQFRLRWEYRDSGLADLSNTNSQIEYNIRDQANQEKIKYHQDKVIEILSGHDPSPWL